VVPQEDESDRSVFQARRRREPVAMAVMDRAVQVCQSGCMAVFVQLKPKRRPPWKTRKEAIQAVAVM
jgi:hypothetical protein